MRPTVRRLVSCLASAALALGAPLSARAVEGPGYTLIALHLKAMVGPDDATECDLNADLYVPATASPATPAPAIIHTNGFGQSKAQFRPMQEFFASQGYVVLSYSGLGHGGSSCRIHMDTPEWDGKAGSAVISFLGGKPGIGFTDAAHTQPVPVVDVVVKDAVDHAGVAQPYDPRVGWWATSYGGGAGFVTAKGDKRLDTLVPVMTWNDIRAGLFPNFTDLTTGVTSATPGVAKTAWGLGIMAVGVLKVTDGPLTPYRTLGCPNWPVGMCEQIVQNVLQGYPDAAARELLGRSSVATYVDQITVPTLLIQGLGDTLFEVNQATATFDALRARRVPVSMIWVSGGHTSTSLDSDLAHPNPAKDYALARTMAWFAHYLRDVPGDTGPDFAYFRDWVYRTSPATPAASFGTGQTTAVGTPTVWYLSQNDLVPTASQVRFGWQSFVTGPGAAPTSWPVGASAGEPADPSMQYSDISLPGTYARYTSASLTAPVRVAGMPKLQLMLTSASAPTNRLLGPVGMVTVYVKVYDVAPDGTRHLINDLRAPVRADNIGQPLQIVLPGIVHEFSAGHRISLEVAGADLNFRGSLVTNDVTIWTGQGVQQLTLPVVP